MVAFSKSASSLPLSVLGLACGLAGLVGTAMAAPGLQAVAGAVGGAGNGNINAGCTTYGSSAVFRDFFGSSEGVAIPVGGIAACGYSGQEIQNTAASGSASVSTGVGPVILGNPGYSGYYSGNSSALAQFTGLHVQAQGAFSSGLPGSPTALFDASSAAFLTDDLTVTSPSVVNTSAGYVAYQFKLSGSASALGTQAPYYFGDARADLAFQQDNGPVYGIANIDARRGSLGTATSGGQPLAGWTASTSSVSGSGTIDTLNLLSPFPIVFGKPWEVKLGLAVHAYGEAQVSFLSTAKLVGVAVFDASGHPITDFTLTSASGTSYMPSVPEPASWQLLVVALALISLGRNRIRNPDALAAATARRAVPRG